MNRQQQLQHIQHSEKVWDMVIVGGGATGLGTALDAASRGLQTLLLEQADFAKGTSSRSTKLVHGGVRYLAQGNIKLVIEALYERGLLLKNAAHLAKNESFIIPNYTWWDGPFYTIGLKVYDILAGRLSLGRSQHISRKEVLRRLPNITAKGLQGGVVYHDGQFDDARLAINLAQTSIEQGATLINYMRVTALQKQQNRISGVVATDMETGNSYTIQAKCVVNATGVFVDELLQMDAPGSRPLVKPSQGVHLVVDKSFLGGPDAIMIPKTEDGRVLFAVPWHDKVVVGTTDTPLDEHTLEPVALEEEISFILRTAAQYLTKAPARSDVRSVFAGLRPLAAPQEEGAKTKEISRSHKILVAASGLVTVTGGKWTTYRKMAEDIVNTAVQTAALQARPCVTKSLGIHGSMPVTNRSNHLFVYGTDQQNVEALYTENAAWSQPLHARLPYLQAEVIWAVRTEMARTVEDVLARRTRALFLDARAAIEMAPQVAALMAAELHTDNNWQQQQVADFIAIATHYLLTA
ncbi:glycerol-3-phosphate dehydrogenase/oxidase [Deminuibacter soli]|uniref:Glycerol-3-phosphate dehydrogenase/oxidase n=1 Tax=Deminuibacter soli TaxID=2291815 RepID=A0A3E1NJ88_9BACT|nr:glycerol-3-phosphate dehydrogenase/oxidase [Deminuibacter soli]RFM27848.1 glycerol-3-phosphate dehydrogenase/oxidase [Deminuibacter soli]